MPPTVYGFPDPRKVLEWQEMAPATAFLSGLGRLLLSLRALEHYHLNPKSYPLNTSRSPHLNLSLTMVLRGTPPPCCRQIGRHSLAYFELRILTTKLVTQSYLP